MHGWRLRKKTLSPGTVEYCQLWWVYDKLKNIHKHSTSKAGKGGELRRVKCLGHPIFSQRKEAIFRKPAYTSRNTKVGKEFFLMVPFFTPPYKWHCYKSHSTLCPQGKLSATHSPRMKKISTQKALLPKSHSKCRCRQASSQASVSLRTTDSCPLPISCGSLH